MVTYPDVTHGKKLAIGVFSIDEDGDFKVGLSASAHIGIGEHAEIAMNVSELFRRLFS